MRIEGPATRAISHGIEDIEKAMQTVSDMPVSCWGE